MYKLLLIALAVFCHLQTWTQTTVVLEASKDNTIYESNSGNLSNGAGTELFTGTTNNNDRRRALVRFDLSTIPAGAMITSATLTLRVDRTVSGNHNVAVHKVAADWGEGTSNADAQEGRGAAATTNDATWVHRFFNSSTWSNPGGDFTGAASASLSVGGNGVYNWTSTQLTADVQAWVTNAATNFGWILVGNESTDRTAKRFASSENSTAANRPKLSVTYTSTACATPSISAFTASSNSICAGQTTTLTVTGDLGGATTWQLYSGSCGGTKLTTSSTGSFSIKPTVTTSYFVRAEGGCVTPGTCNTLSVTVNVKDEATISYASAQFCAADPDPSPSISGKTGGTFSATPSGLSINAQSGIVDLSSSTAGRTYTVRYITSGTCPDTSTAQLAISATASANISYAQAIFCPGDANPSPTITGTTGGQFTAGNGLTINAQTGVITLASSAPGTYRVIYSTPGGACQVHDTISLSVGQNKISELAATICSGETYQFGDLSLDKAGIYDMTLNTSLGCDSLVVLSLTVTSIDTVVSITDQGLEVGEDEGSGITFAWLDCDRSFAPVAGASSRLFLPSTPGHYAALVTKGGCEDTTSCINYLTTSVAAQEFKPLKVFPNPATTYLSLDGFDNIGMLSLEMLDLTGKKYAIWPAAGRYVELPVVPAGFYFIRLIDKGTIYQTKLIIRPE